MIVGYNYAKYPTTIAKTSIYDELQNKKYEQNITRK